MLAGRSELTWQVVFVLPSDARIGPRKVFGIGAASSQSVLPSLPDVKSFSLQFHIFLLSSLFPFQTLQSFNCFRLYPSPLFVISYLYSSFSILLLPLSFLYL